MTGRHRASTTMNKILLMSSSVGNTAECFGPALMSQPRLSSHPSSAPGWAAGTGHKLLLLSENPTLEIFKVPFSMSGSSENLSYRIFLDKLNILLCGVQHEAPLAIFSILWGLHCYLHEFKFLYILQPLDDQEHRNTFPNTLDSWKKQSDTVQSFEKLSINKEQLVSCSHSFASSPHSLVHNFHLILHPDTLSSTF